MIKEDRLLRAALLGEMNQAEEGGEQSAGERRCVSSVLFGPLTPDG